MVVLPGGGPGWLTPGWLVPIENLPWWEDLRAEHDRAASEWVQAKLARRKLDRELEAEKEAEHDRMLEVLAAGQEPPPGRHNRADKARAELLDKAVHDAEQVTAEVVIRVIGALRSHREEFEGHEDALPVEVQRALSVGPGGWTVLRKRELREQLAALEGSIQILDEVSLGEERYRITARGHEKIVHGFEYLRESPRTPAGELR